MRGHLRKRGSAWELRAYAGIDPLANRQKYRTRTFRGGKREAEEALARFVTEVSGGGHAAQDTTVGDLIRDWLALVNRELSPTKARGYDWIVKTYITPTLGKVPLMLRRVSVAEPGDSSFLPGERVDSRVYAEVNTWQSDTTMNVADLQGMIAGFQAEGATTVGAYSTSSQWNSIRGGTGSASGSLYQIPNWIPGARGLSGAEANCAQTSFTAGTVTVTQWFGHPDDGDYAC